MTNKVERRETYPAKPALPADGRRPVLGLRMPEAMPSRFYRDPLLVMIDEEEREAARIARKEAEAATVPVLPCRDRYWRQARRLQAMETAKSEIQRIMKGLR